MRHILDKIGMASSLVCAVHCVVLPLMAGSLSLFGAELAGNAWLEAATLMTSLIVGGLAVWRGLRHHGEQAVLLFFLAGAAFMIGGTFSPQPFEWLLKLSGVLLLITAHGLNWWRCRWVHRSGSPSPRPEGGMEAIECLS